MKQTISPAYAALNAQLHNEREDYGAEAQIWAKHVVTLCRSGNFKTILDFGCGKGALKPAVEALAPDLRVLEYDPAIEGKTELPTEPIDLLVGVDMMEHIEPEYLDAVLQTMCDLGSKGVFLTISTRPAHKTLADGRNAHLIVQPSAWWRETLSRYFKPKLEREVKDSYIYAGIPL